MPLPMPLPMSCFVSLRRRITPSSWFLVVVPLASALLLACSADEPQGGDSVEPWDQRCRNDGTPGATSRCLAPTHDAAYYADQANSYFDTLDVDADRESIPDYAPLVARWEWPPWLLLTGLGREDMIETAEVLRDADPSTVPVRDCRGFDEQPFARCYVVFEYEGGACPIYEEFTFNDQGQMTFIEAWSDLDGLRPMDVDADPWADAPDVPRLSTRVPGLGNEEGRIDIGSNWMREAARANPDVADFAERATDWWKHWFEALKEAPPDYFSRGCGW